MPPEARKQARQVASSARGANARTISRRPPARAGRRPGAPPRPPGGGPRWADRSSTRVAITARSHALQPVGQVGQRGQRRVIGPVGVVDEHRDRTLAGEVGRQPVERVAGANGSSGAVTATPSSGMPSSGAANRPPVNSAAGSRPSALQGLVEELAHDAERELLRARRRAYEDHESGLGRGLPCRLHQRRLADAGGPVDDHHAAGALRSRGDRLLHHRELGVALEQRRGAHATLEAVRSRSIGPMASASPARASDAELAVGVAQVELHGGRADEQRLAISRFSARPPPARRSGARSA